MKEKILDGCYYPGCEADHLPDKKFCGSGHKHLSPARKDQVCHCGDLMSDHHGLSHNHAPVAMEHRDCNGHSSMEEALADPEMNDEEVREVCFPDYPVIPRTDAEFTTIPGSEDLGYDDEDLFDDDWMDDADAQESWIAKQMKGI